jgi:hypothetical protein
LSGILPDFFFSQRRWQQRERHDFNITAFKQQSSLLNDEPPSASGDRSTPGEFPPPPPPKMAERSRLSITTGGWAGTSPAPSPGEIVQPAIAITSPPPGTLVPFFVPSRPPSASSPLSAPYRDSPYGGLNSASQNSNSQTPRSLPLPPPLAPSAYSPSGSSITQYYTGQRSGVSDRTSGGQAGTSSEGMTDAHVRLSDFPPVPDSGVSGASGGAAYANQAGLHKSLSPFVGAPSFNAVPESPFADPHIQTDSQPEQPLPNEQTDLLVPIMADTSSDKASLINPLPEIHFQLFDNTDMLRVSSSEFPVSALANSFAIPSPPVRDSLEKPQAPPAVVIKPSPLREATTASVSSPDSLTPSTRDIKGKGKAKMTDSFYEADEYPYAGI